jgi:hypothetical protein
LTTKLHINLAQGIVDVDGDPEFVKQVYDDIRDIFISKLSDEGFGEELSDSGDEKAEDDKKKPMKRSRVKRSGPSCAGRIRAIQEEEFFKTLKTSGDVRSKLTEKGTTYPSKNVAAALTSMTKAGELRRVKEGGGWKYQNP